MTAPYPGRMTPRRRPNHALEPMTAGRWLVWALWLVAVLVGLGWL